MFKPQSIENLIDVNIISRTNQNSYLTIDPKCSQKKLTPRFHQITQDLDQSFISRNQQNTKTNLNKSKIFRKDTQQTDPSNYKISNNNQILSKNQSFTSLIEKSQSDPFVRRKIQAIMDNNLKSLKKLNDQSGKTPKNFGSNTSIFSGEKKKVTNQTNQIQSQYTRIPRDIEKLLIHISSKQFGADMKKMNSQPFLTTLSSKKLKHKMSLADNQEQARKQKSFTTLRKEAYKKKIQNLQILKEVPDQKVKKVLKL